jgi:CRISPR-associated protein Cas2
MAASTIRRKPMVVIILERVPPNLRGDLTRWLLELRTGVFVGKLNMVVRRKVWERVCSGMKSGAGILIYSARNEQGFEIEFWGATDRSLVDRDGLKLLQVLKPE